MSPGAVYRHGLPASEVEPLHVEDLDFKTARIMIHRLKGSHSGERSLQPDEGSSSPAPLMLFTRYRPDALQPLVDMA
jgi:hypothetical protein